MQASSQLPAYRRWEDQPYAGCLDDLPTRSELIHGLIEAYDILQQKQDENVTSCGPIIEVVDPERGSLLDLQLFHSKEYVKALFEVDHALRKADSSQVNDKCSDDEEVLSDAESSDEDRIEDLKNQFGLVDDAFAFKGMVRYQLRLL